MSIKALAALLGEERVARMNEFEIAELADILDAEILKDERIKARLNQIIGEAVERLQRKT